MALTTIEVTELQKTKKKELGATWAMLINGGITHFTDGLQFRNEQKELLDNIEKYQRKVISLQKEVQFLRERVPLDTKEGNL